MKPLFIALLPIVLLLYFRATAGTHGTLAGTITDATDRPLAGIMLRLAGTNRSAVSNDKGEFIFARLLPGSYTLLVPAIGPEPVAGQVAVTTGMTTSIQVSLTSQPVPRASALHCPTDKKLPAVDKAILYTTTVALSTIQKQSATFTIPAVEFCSTATCMPRSCALTRPALYAIGAVWIQTV